MKSKRQAKIMEIISTTNVETQEQLLDALREAGFNSTQATISRDIKELRIIKEFISEPNCTTKTFQRIFTVRLTV